MTVAPVSLTVDHDQPDWGKIQDLLRALAGIVTDQAELARAGKLFSPISAAGPSPSLRRI